jgi:hypothetical protein
MRNRDQWEGPIRLVGVTVPNIPGRLKKPTSSDEIDMYLQPDLVTPSTVNVIPDHRMFRWPENILAVFVALLSAFGFSWWKKTTITQSAVLGFLVAWGALSLRRIYSDFSAVSAMETRKPGMFGLVSITEFMDSASGMIGNETWEDDLDGVYRSYVHYRLAERQYIPQNSGGAGAFRITRNPGNGQVVWRKAEYYLVKNTLH